MAAQESQGNSNRLPDETLAGLSAFVARVLNQLSLSAWLPSAFLTIAGSFLLQFRAQESFNFAGAAAALTKHPPTVLILALPVLVTTTLVMQAFSFEAIRTLEGYWHRPGIPSLIRNLMIRRHVWRKSRLRARRRNASARAFAHARLLLLDANIPPEVVNALELSAIGKRSSLAPEHKVQFQKMSWRSKCNAWELARVDDLLLAEQSYPKSSRILPTRLGNIIRATEDKLTNATMDIEGYVLQRAGLVSERVQRQHDQFRARLEMYCILVFVSELLAALTPALLWGRSINLWAILGILGGFLAVSFSSYQAAVASAKGYCAALKEMDNAPAGRSQATRLNQ